MTVYNLVGGSVSSVAHTPWQRNYTSGGRVTTQLILMPQFPFRPRYLFLDGNLHEVEVTRMLVGQHIVALSAPGPLPARMFRVEGLTPKLMPRVEQGGVLDLVVEIDEEKPWPLPLEADAVAFPGVHLVLDLVFPGELPWAINVAWAGTRETGRAFR